MPVAHFMIVRFRLYGAHDKKASKIDVYSFDTVFSTLTTWPSV